MKPKMLMCSPEYFGVEYVINPWMENQVHHIDRPKAHRQWEAFHRTLSQQAEIFVLDSKPDMPDMVFTANAGLLVDGTFVLSRFKHPERQVEEPHFRDWFQQYTGDVAQLPDAIAFEGEGDALPQPGQDWIWAGYGFRTDLAAHRFIEQKVKRPVISLHLINPRFYHLDTCFCPLPDDRAMYYPDAFDADSLRCIESRIAPENRLLVSAEDAGHFACNTVRVHDTLFMNQISPALHRQLEVWGYRVALCPVDEFMKAGGANKCLTLVLDAADRPHTLHSAADQVSTSR